MMICVKTFLLSLNGLPDPPKQPPSAFLPGIALMWLHNKPVYYSWNQDDLINITILNEILQFKCNYRQSHLPEMYTKLFAGY